MVYLGKEDPKLANIPSSTKIRIGNRDIKRVSSTKSLGVYIDERLSWSNHIDHIAKKVSSAIGGLKQIRPFVSKDVLILIYNSLIQPQFDYCDVIWDTLSKELATRLQRLQNRAARVITKSTYEIRSHDIRKDLGWEELSHRRAKHKALLMHKIHKKIRTTMPS